ncbi:MAG: transglycosylase SLT domain-containing protein [Gemmatimonadales bacterium]
MAVVGVFAVLSASGCALLGGGGAGPELVPHDAVLPQPRVQPLESRIEIPRRAHPTIEVTIDEILASPVGRDPDFQASVAAWVEYWSGTAGEAVPDYLGRMASYGMLVDSSLLAAKLPASLRYLPFIESGYNPRAASRASAVGMWQFMSATAGGLGLQVSALLDERRDPERSTAAAVAFLSDLREEFGSWFIALAAYNGGPNRMRRVLATYAPGVAGSDSLFWALRSHFPRETRDFVPKLFGAVVVGSNAGQHEPKEHPPFRFDAVTVPDATSLDVIARAASVEQEEIERLNPQFVRGMTPPGRVSAVRVPEGKGPEFIAAYALIPVNERVSFVEHRVASGETLSHIALRYGVRVADIQAANPSVRPRYLRVGTLLTVPVAPSARTTVRGS